MHNKPSESKVSLYTERDSKVRHIIGVDIMGSDNSPELLFDAALSLQPTLPHNVSLLAIGHPRYLTRSGIDVCEAKETIEMDEPPLLAIRRKRNASLCIGLRMLKKGQIDAFVSAGNTGALVSFSKMALSTLKGLKRPALLVSMPTKRHPITVLDVGANVQCKPHHLVQFALIGAAYQKALGNLLPKVGLLNIGREAVKGTADLRFAYQELAQLGKRENAPFQFVGNIEGKAVFDGEIDVLVTDGFTGNVFLKTAEGIASLILDRLSETLPSNALHMAGEKLLDLRRHLHYAEYPGALLAGVKGIVIKCHGYSSPAAFASGIVEAVRLTREHFLQHLQRQLVFCIEQ